MKTYLKNKREEFKGNFNNKGFSGVRGSVKARETFMLLVHKLAGNQKKTAEISKNSSLSRSELYSRNITNPVVFKLVLNLLSLLLLLWVF